MPKPKSLRRQVRATRLVELKQKADGTFDLTDKTTLWAVREFAKHEKQIGDLRKLVNVLKQVEQQKFEQFGKNLSDELRQWLQAEREKLDKHGARKDYDELCAAGCNPDILIFLIFLVRKAAQALAGLWMNVVGDKRRRERLIKRLDKAEATIREVFGNLVDDVEINEKLLQVQGTTPKQVIEQIDLYKRLLSLGKKISAGSHLHSFDELFKYLIVGYVRHATSDFRDRNVAGIFSEISTSQLTEDAVKMWRNRSYAAIHKENHGLVEFLGDLAFVLNHPA